MDKKMVSTHSHPKAAGSISSSPSISDNSVSTHSHPKAAGLLTLLQLHIPNHCFNTQPPEGGWKCLCCGIMQTCLFQHTATRRRLVETSVIQNYNQQFQHTATRRRLALDEAQAKIAELVSTHSHPKAAGIGVMVGEVMARGFNTQPPEGGWIWGWCFL